MKAFFKILLIFLSLCPCNIFAKEYLYILNDKCINELYNLAEIYFKNTTITPIKDSRGIILRLNFENSPTEFYNVNNDAYKRIEYFLAKIQNPAIIEVHIVNLPEGESQNLKKWEVSTIMANNIEAIITEPAGTIAQNRINSIGYGEFLPAKNTSNNGGKNSNRVDIIILCNVSGE